MTAHAIASTFDSGLQRLVGLAFDMHQDRAIARQEAAYEQRERSMSAVSRVAARVRDDAATIAALQAEVARLRAESDQWRVRALGAEGRLEDVAGALRTLRGSRRAA
ncbi:hypothetical protein A3862_04585 [Methylobacterium sp. XJLW]|uniref:response regulator receiver protein n=1 Tax=Methylobacterium sp. XJLW TaxID=739141 RepID=UPI000DAB0BA8|nr:response regulator receiver protein [Methylobacterium sp. XJLW]AWV19276.1 hypothetical protein A3862_04585 [Methylobacterium sp. XJLW]